MVQQQLPSPYSQLSSHHHCLYMYNYTTHNPEMGNVSRKEFLFQTKFVVLWFCDSSGAKTMQGNACK